VSGQSFTAFVADRQFRPAGMTHTRFADSEDVVESSASAYRRAPAADDGRGASGSWVVEFERFPTFLRPAAGIVSTAQDLAQWVVALRSGVLLKQADSLRELWEPVVLNNGALGGFNIAGLNGYALGWSAMVRNSHPAVAAMGGARAALYIYPCDDLAIIILTNLQGANPEEFIDTLALSYRREVASRGIKPPATQEH
jgi:CubicO group peptidase (beta-lactamase class C family)